MAIDKNTSDDKQQTGTQQHAQHEKAPINPFKDKEGSNNEPTIEEETELEQQRKEALTERD